MVSLQLLAFGFANAAILGWLAAAAAPILIHLWMKRVRRETPWAAVRFLRKAIERHARRLKLREWLLLAVRTAIVLLVVLAAAKPVLEGLGLAGPGVRTHYLLVMDASLSMQYQTDDGTLLEGGKRLAKELLDGRRSGDVFSLVLMADPPRAAIGQPTSDAARVRRAVEAIEPTDGAADLASVLAVTAQVLDRSREQTQTVDRHEVVVFTDLARHSWGAAVDGGAAAGQGGAAGGGDASAVRQTLASLSDAAEVSVVDLGVDGAANTSITKLAFADALPTAGRPLRVSATARTIGTPADATNPTQPSTAELVVNGVSVATKPVAVSNKTTVTIDFTHRFTRPGVHAVEVRVGDDRLPTDNSGWLGLTLPDRTRVLCVAGGPGAARYVANALRPGGADGDALGSAAIEPVVISDSELSSVDLAEFAAVFFCNVAQVSEREADRIRGYARGGGGVVFFLGDRVLPAAYNRVLAGGAGRGGLGVWPGGRTVPLTLVANNKTAEPLLPLVIEKVVDSQSFTIDPLDYSHPIAKPFEGRERAGLLTTPIARYWRVSLSREAERAAVALASTAGDPLLVTSECGRGRVAVFATAGSLASVDAATGEPWTVMPAWPSFLPIVRELLNFAAGGGDAAAWKTVGEPIGGVAPPGAGEVEVLRPDERTATVVVGAGGVELEGVDGVGDGDDRGWSYDRADRAGVYRVRKPGAATDHAAVGVNASPAESDLTRVAIDSLPDSVTVRRVSTRAAAGDALPASTGVHRTLLLAALVLVLLETALAYWFGRPPA